MLAAVKQTGSALQYASNELKNDRIIVLAAVNQNGQALRFASDELKNDMCILIPAVANGWVWWDIHLEKYINNVLLQSERFMVTFLTGWSLSPTKTSQQGSKFPMLNKLGKYGSISVKKLIADYVGIYYGEKLSTARKASNQINGGRTS
jgi:hypothetical protein